MSRHHGVERAALRTKGLFHTATAASARSDAVHESVTVFTETILVGHGA